MRKQLLSLLCVALFIMSFIAPMSSRSVAATGASQQTSPVNTTPDGFILGPEVPGAYATLIRNKNGITTNVHTTVADAGAYTLWWVIYNHPENCTNPDDTYSCEYDEPDIVVNATGHVSSGGNLNLSAWVGIGGPYSGEIIYDGPDDSLTNPTGAVVLLVVRYHGPAIPGMIPTQINTYLGGCPEDSGAPCADEQLVLFAP